MTGETTSLPPHFDPEAVEPKLVARWLDTNVGRADVNSSKPKFSIVMPPPNVTGQLHIGHALDMTLQDVVVRNKRQRGFDVLWLPGTDHASIATHFVIERDLAKTNDTRFTLGREAFLERAAAWKEQSAGAIQAQLRRLGCTPDWSRESFTLNPDITRAVVRVFVQLYREGLIYRGSRLVNWDPKFRTAISDLEVETREVEGHLWYIRYPLADDPSRGITVSDDPSRDAVRRPGRGRQRRRPTLQGPDRPPRHAAADRAYHPDHRRRTCRPGAGDGRRQDHAGA